MIIDLLSKGELEKMSVEDLNELKKSIMSVLEHRVKEVNQQEYKTAREKETERIFENIKKNAITLAEISKPDFGGKIADLLEQERYADVIEWIAKMDFGNRKRPYQDDSRYSEDNQLDVRALLIYRNLQDGWIWCDDLGSRPIDVADAFHHYDIEPVLVPSFIDGEITEETVQKYLVDMQADQELNRDLFFKLVMHAEENGGPKPERYTFVDAIQDTPLHPLPFQQKRFTAATGEKARKLSEIQDRTKPELQTRGINM
jgi:hypothetical protein